MIRKCTKNKLAISTLLLIRWLRLRDLAAFSMPPPNLNKPGKQFFS